MKILLTNDDGVFAPGLTALYKRLVYIGDVTVVAPADVQSAMSHSISLSPVIIKKVKVANAFSGYSVQGSPADCVKLAVKEIIEGGIDLIVSGMNHGANVGVNICYSGTVAAAMEGAFYNIPSIALSAAFEDSMDFDKSVHHAMKVIEKLLPLKGGDVVNVNVPPLNGSDPKGVKVVPQSISGYEERYEKTTNNSGEYVYQLFGGDHYHEEHETDMMSIMDGYITVTALHYDMTEYKRNSELKAKVTSNN